MVIARFRQTSWTGGYFVYSRGNWIQSKHKPKLWRWSKPRWSELYVLLVNMDLECNYQFLWIHEHSCQINFLLIEIDLDKVLENFVGTSFRNLSTLMWSQESWIEKKIITDSASSKSPARLPASPTRAQMVSPRPQEISLLLNNANNRGNLASSTRRVPYTHSIRRCAIKIARINCWRSSRCTSAVDAYRGVCLIDAEGNNSNGVDCYGCS